MIAVFASLITPRFLGHSGSRRDRDAANIKSLKTALNNFKLDCKRYPTESEGLKALITSPPQVKGWRGPYLELILKDKWKRDYLDERASRTEIRVYSYGKDGKLGGEGDDADTGLDPSF